MRIYLDNNATTALDPDVLAGLARVSGEVCGNASSIHKEGQTARRVIEDAREAVARLIGAAARDLVFTSGGTESNNAAIFGAVGPAPRSHIVTTAIEHPSVGECVRALSHRGHEATFVPPGRDGVVAAEDVIAAMRPETRLVTVMLANNETGVLQPVAAIGRACRERGIHFHCDAVQAVGKIPVSIEELACDTLAMSAHKIHGPKGIGALYVRRSAAMEPLLYGGAQERRRRAGTEPVPLAHAFGVAATIAASTSYERVGALRDRLERALVEASGDRVTINGATAPRLPNTSSMTFHGVDAEGMVIALDLAGIAVSTGSACSSGRIEPSPVLLAMGLSQTEARSTVRFSLSRFTTAEEIDRTVELVREVVGRARG